MILIVFSSEIGEEYLLKTTSGASVYTFSASRTFGVVDDGAVVNYRDCTGGTSLFALFARDTSVLARLAGICALVLVAAIYRSCGFLGNHRNYMSGACFSANAATETTAGVDMRNSITDADSISCTDRSAVSATKAAVTAGIRTAKKHRCRATGAYSFISRLLGDGSARSVTMNECNYVLGRLDLDTEYLTKLLRGILRTGNTKVRLCLAFCKSYRIVVAALISARSTVYTGEARSDLLCFLVLLYTKELYKESEKNS